MDTVINRLSDIEEAAGAIVEEANVRKKAYAAEIEKKTADFDQELDQETARRIAEIQKKMETDMDQLLAEQRLWSIFGVFCLTKKSLGIWQTRSFTGEPSSSFWIYPSTGILQNSINLPI